MRVMDMPGWMPRTVGAFAARDGDAIAGGQGKIQSVLRVKEDHVVFTCELNRRAVYFDFSVPDINASEKIAEILRRNRGRTLISISTIELPADEDAPL